MKMLIVVLISIVTIAVAGLAFFGRGETVEFSKETLSYREREVFYFPSTDIALFSFVRSTWPYPLREMWKKQGYLKNIATKGETWDLVNYWTPGNAMRQTVIANLDEAKLVNFPSYWHSWTQANPKEAAILWPSVIQNIKSQRYYEAFSEMQKHAW